MALTVTSRPAKEIDGRTSTWNCTNLPIQYKLNSDLFPTNSVDPTIVINVFSNVDGYLKVDLAAASPITLEGEYVTLSGCNVEAYNSTWRIKELITNTAFILEVGYNASLTTGNFQKHYINYFTEIKVFGGLPSWHVDYASNPIVEVGTLRVIPNVDNDIIASFSGIIKADIDFSNQLSEGIELSSFTGFYLQWREGYDENVNGIIETVYSAWQIDEVANCGNELVTNGDFATDLSGWTQTGTGDAFTWNAGSAYVSFTTDSKSQYLYQSIDLVANVEYAITADITNGGGGLTFDILASNDLINFDILGTAYVPTTPTLSFNTVPTKDYQYIVFRFKNAAIQFGFGTIDNISVSPTVCEYLFWGNNSSLQFQNSRGGNMYDYVARDVNSKFMTNFNTPTLFSGEYFDTSIILNSASVADFDISDIADMWMVATDIGLADGSAISIWDDRTGNVSVTAAALEEPTFTESGTGGLSAVTFNGVDQFFSTDINITHPVIMYFVIDFNAYTSTVIDTLSPNRNLVFLTDSGDKIILNSGENLSSTDNSVSLSQLYVFKFVFNGENSEIYIDNVLNASGDVGDNTTLQNMAIGKNLNIADFMDGDIYEMAILPMDVDPCRKWQTDSYFGTKYGTYSLESFAYVQNEYNTSGGLIQSYLNDITFQDTGVYRIEPTVNNVEAGSIDLQIINGESCSASEVKNINVNSDCSNQDIYITWLNTLGGWDYWKFTAEKDHNLNIESKDTIKRNVFANWDDTFINGDTQLDAINTLAHKEVGVFSQYLNEDELNAISGIKYSPKVQVLEGGKLTTVIVDKDNILLFNDGDEETLYTIRFNIRFPDIQSQSQ